MPIRRLNLIEMRNQFDCQWQRLVELARQADDRRDCVAPFGFALRVATQAAAALPPVGMSVEQFAVRGLLMAVGLAAVAFVYDVTRLTSAVRIDDCDGVDLVGEQFFPD